MTEPQDIGQDEGLEGRRLVPGKPTGRRRSRELALQVLYQIDATGQDWQGAFDLFCGSFEAPGAQQAFAKRLVEGVAENRERIDGLIEAHSQHWRLPRMSRVDRNVLRMAIFELIWCHDIPPRVTLDEAVELGKRFGTEESGSFVNGILDAVFAAECQHLEPEPEPEKEED